MSKQLFNSVLKKATKVGAQVYDQGREIYSTTARHIEQRFGSEEEGDDDGTRAHSNSNGVVIDVPKSVEINGERYRISKLLDEGGFSYVFLVRNSMGEEFALKKLLIQEEEAYQNAMREIKFMVCILFYLNLNSFQKQLSGHENVINVLGEKVVSVNAKREVFILMELADDSLISVIQRKAENNTQFKEDQM
jgi:serine/threonine protein kinase